MIDIIDMINMIDMIQDLDWGEDKKGFPPNAK